MCVCVYNDNMLTFLCLVLPGEPGEEELEAIAAENVAEQEEEEEEEEDVIQENSESESDSVSSSASAICKYSTPSSSVK